MKIIIDNGFFIKIKNVVSLQACFVLKKNRSYDEVNDRFRENGVSAGC